MSSQSSLTALNTTSFLISTAPLSMGRCRKKSFARLNGKGPQCLDWDSQASTSACTAQQTSAEGWKLFTSKSLADGGDSRSRPAPSHDICEDTFPSSERKPSTAVFSPLASAHGGQALRKDANNQARSATPLQGMAPFPRRPTGSSPRAIKKIPKNSTSEER
ncbi:unnamed protein product [Trypanosoma congolense IL3000]|uniref:WGS project CAEQ00000000 data, annotated contig 799 n=1 Tax=Trypanosoma congolense (strain IL3000) TaxID=1068625 RepID=F9WII6_TRYCI|nr:unnamed protein product [Trypanosoma congolense IL3000]